MNDIYFSYVDNTEDEDLNETSDFHFIVPCDMHISQFHYICTRIALALGYAEKNVEEYFGQANLEI